MPTVCNAHNFKYSEQASYILTSVSVEPTVGAVKNRIMCSKCTLDSKKLILLQKGLAPI